jgi:hypothetical protein
MTANEVDRRWEEGGQQQAPANKRAQAGHIVSSACLVLITCIISPVFFSPPNSNSPLFETSGHGATLYMRSLRAGLSGVKGTSTSTSWET